MSTQNPPETIGGYQHLQPDVIAKEDDIFVRAGIVRGFVSSDYAGQTVAALEAEFKGWHVYRKIPCPRQGGERHPECFSKPGDDAMARDTPTPLVIAPTYNGPAHSAPASDWEKKRGVIVARALERNTLPTDAKARKATPIATGVLDYFPKALAEVARVSLKGNEQHHPGEPLHWDKSKSTDESDALIRHFMERGKIDTDGMRHSAKVAWRALALLERELEAEDGK